MDSLQPAATIAVEIIQEHSAPSKEALQTEDANNDDIATQIDDPDIRESIATMLVDAVTRMVIMDNDSNIFI